MLESLLNERRHLLADGATGTNYFEAGLAAGDAPELWNLAHPERVAALHHAFIEAGADIILTNSFGANRRRLRLHQAEDKVHEINRRAAEIARQAADGANRPVVVAGSMGPTGDLFAPLGELSADEAGQAFAEQAAGLKEGGADVLWIETMSAYEEICAAAEAAIGSGLPYVFTASFDTAGRTMMGLPPGDMPQLAQSLPLPPLAFGANCGVGAPDLLAAILEMTGAAADAVVVAKANCGIPQVHGSHVHYSGTPELMAAYTRLALDAGARIVGGCCGTSPAHVAAMRRTMDAYSPGERPDVARLVSEIGPLIMQPAPAGQVERRRRRPPRPR